MAAELSKHTVFDAMHRSFPGYRNPSQVQREREKCDTTEEPFRQTA